MKTSEIFKRAKQHLATDYNETRYYPCKEKFICLAIDLVCLRNGRATEADRSRCAGIITSRLEGAYTLEGWLESTGCIKNYLLCDRITYDRIQEHRHAWLDLLIAEFKSKGD